MPWTGSAPNQTTQRTDGVRTGNETWQEAQAAAIGIESDDHDIHDSDLADMINDCLKKDGGNQPTAAMPWNSQRITGLGAPTARTDAMRLDKVQDSTTVYAGTSSGTDTITATLSPAITAYVTGQRYHFKAGGTNTGACTLNFNSVGAKSVKKGLDGASDPEAGDITEDGVYSVVYDGTNFQLENPGLGSLSIVGQTALTAPAVDDSLPIYDLTATANRKITLANLFKVINALTAETAPAVDDELALYDASGSATDKITLANLLTVVNALTEDTTPDRAADFLLSYDTSASAVKKVKVANMVTPGALVAILEDRKSSGSGSGNFQSGADRTRTLNTTVYNRNSLVSLSSNQFTLPAGDWEIEWSAAGYGVEEHQSMLYDVTGESVIARGTSESSNDSTDTTSRSVGSFRVSPSGSNAYEIRHRCSSTQATGFGKAAGFGTEVYARVIIRGG